MTKQSGQKRRTILISGAGIAGLASALFVARAGYRVEIFEQAEKLDPIGSGLQLSPNAMHVLAQLGLERQIKSVAIAPVKIDIRNGTSGRVIVQIPLGTNIVRSFGQPYLVIHRADLQKILLSACENEPDILIRNGTKVVDAVQHSNGVSVLGSSAAGTFNFRGVGLVGADGVHSVIRNECFECKPAVATKTTALRAMLPTSQIAENLRSDNITMWLAPNAHLVLYPVRGGQYTNIVITVPDNFDTNFKTGGLSGFNIKAGLNGWHEEVTDLLDANTNWSQWPLYEAPSLSSWQENCTILIGDAAHAMTPHAAQGAAMGLEDAAVLGFALSSRENIVDAFSLYQEKRLTRANAVRRISRTNKMIYQLPQPMGSFRNLAMRMMGGSRIFARQNWIYSWNPPIPGQLEV